MDYYPAQIQLDKEDAKWLTRFIQFQVKTMNDAAAATRALRLFRATTTGSDWDITSASTSAPSGLPLDDIVFYAFLEFLDTRQDDARSMTHLEILLSAYGV